MPESRPTGRRRAVDYLGAVLCALGLAGLVFALTSSRLRGWGDPLVAGPLLGGLALLALVRAPRGPDAHPMLPLALFRTRNFAVGNAATLLIWAGSAPRRST